MTTINLPMGRLLGAGVLILALIVVTPMRPLAGDMTGDADDGETTDAAPAAVVEGIYRLFAEGRVEATFDMVTEDFTMYEPGPTDILPWAGHFEGRQGFIEFNTRLGQAVSAIRIDDARFEHIGGGRVMIRATETGTSAKTGKTYESRSIWIWTVKGGKITGMRAWHDTEAMAAAFRGN